MSKEGLISSKEVLSKDAFGTEFKWGVAASALQSEGAYREQGKGLSIWDDFATKSKKILNSDTPADSAEFFYNYREDIALVKKLGIPNFRFSISWARILPEGTGKINSKGLAFYHKVIDTCLELD